MKTWPHPARTLRINPDRSWDSLMEMAKIGPGVAGGNNRQTLTDDDGEGRHLFQRWCEAAGLDAGRRRRWARCSRAARAPIPDALPVYVGSHLDTQPTGGKYDGVLGVLGGARGGPLAERSRHQDQAPDRRHQLDQRGGRALRAGDAGLGRVRRRASSRTGPTSARTATASASATSWSGSAGRATSRSARARCTPSSSCTSSRGRSSRPRASTSASSPTARG